MAAVSCADGAIRVFNVISGQPMRTFHGRASAEQIRWADDDLLISTYADK